MKVGALDKRVEIQQKVAASSSTSGRKVGTWLTIVTVWGNIQDVMPSRSASDESAFQGAKEVTKRRTRIRIRWRDDITSDYRLKVTHPRARVLQIVGGPADIGGRKTYIEMMCEEVSTDG